MIPFDPDQLPSPCQAGMEISDNLDIREHTETATPTSGAIKSIYSYNLHIFLRVSLIW